MDVNTYTQVTSNLGCRASYSDSVLEEERCGNDPSFPSSLTSGGAEVEIQRARLLGYIK